MASSTQWTRVSASSRRWWSPEKTGMLQPMGWQRVGLNWATEQQQQILVKKKKKSTIYVQKMEIIQVGVIWHLWNSNEVTLGQSPRKEPGWEGDKRSTSELWIVGRSGNTFRRNKATALSWPFEKGEVKIWQLNHRQMPEKEKWHKQKISVLSISSYSQRKLCCSRLCNHQVTANWKLRTKC